MPDVEVKKLVKFSGLKKLATRTKNELDALSQIAASAIKYVSVANNTVSFFTNTTGTGTAAFSFNFPNELVLDQLGTSYENPFTFSAETYPGATNPNLDGKPVLIIAIKDTNAAGTVTRTYSFLNMEDLVDVYTVALGDSAKVITINGKVITFHVSATTGNHLTVNNDGLMVDVSDKIDKVTGATAGNIPVFVAGGGIVDSDYAIAEDTEVDTMITEVFGAESGN